MTQGSSLKQLERSRRDEGTQSSGEEIEISDVTALPNNWKSFLSVRANKRRLVNFLSIFFLLSFYPVF